MLASIWTAITAALSTARVSSAVAAAGLTAAAVAALAAGAWLWFVVHDDGIRSAATAACRTQEQVAALLAERDALRTAAASRRDTDAQQREDATASAARITELENHNEELRNAVAANGGDTAVVFQRDDRWLQGRRAGIGAAAARRR